MVIRDARVGVDRILPTQDVVVSYPPAGAQSSTVLVGDLDQNPVHLVPGRVGEGGIQPASTIPFFEDHTVKLQQHEAWTLVAFLHTERWHCRWTLRLEGLVGKRSFAVEIPGKGGRFNTTYRPIERFPTEWAWYENPPRFITTRS